MTALFEQMDATGIGYAGIDGVWWWPAAAPFALPAATAGELRRSASALFTLLAAVADLYGTPAGADGGLDALLENKVPAAIARTHVAAPVLALRPDFQLVPGPGGYALVATELEICPSAHGFAHAMQVGYGLIPDIVRVYAEMLGDRELIVVYAGAWSEFLFDQLAFCRALAERGARARVLCDTPPDVIAAEVRRGERWQPPIFGVSHLPPGWDADIPARLARHGLAAHLAPDADWPESVGDAVVFRFGYFNCFTPARLELMGQWERGGATFLNPTSFIYESKATLAALQLPAVRARVAALQPDALATLDRCIPETHLLHEGIVARLLAEREGWVLKYAGFDQSEEAWGGRSLRVGAQLSPEAWASAVRDYLARPWPSVAQRAVPSARINIDYLDRAGGRHTLTDGNTRLRAFLLKTRVGAEVLGAHLTVSAGGGGVSEATDAVQAPCVIRA
jgi:hypothetical protein